MRDSRFSLLDYSFMPSEKLLIIVQLQSFITSILGEWYTANFLLLSDYIARLQGKRTIFLTDDSSDHKILFFCKVLKMDTENNQIVFCCSLARPTVAFCKTNLLAQRDWFFQLVETAAWEKNLPRERSREKIDKERVSMRL